MRIAVRSAQYAGRSTSVLFFFCGLLAASCVLSSCNKSPFDRTRDASSGGATGTFTGDRSLPVFSNELKTGGGAFIYPGDENQTLSFSDTSNPVSARSIKYVWNGGNVTTPGCPSNPQHDFAGFTLIHTPTQAEYATTPGRDLSAAGYSKVTFFARGSLSDDTVLKIEAATPSAGGGCPAPTASPCITLYGENAIPSNVCVGGGSSAQLTSSWQQYTITGLTSSDLDSIQDFFKATYVYSGGTAAGQGGTVYFDQIQYEP
jgi:hypothetical protein